MHAVGDVSDRHFLRWPVRKQRPKQVPAHLAVQAAHTIHCATPADRQIRHIERLRRGVRIFAAQGQQIIERDAELLPRVPPPQTVFNLGWLEPVKTGGHRRVGGK